jgi:hypothetical protein
MYFDLFCHALCCVVSCLVVCLALPCPVLSNTMLFFLVSSITFSSLLVYRILSCILSFIVDRSCSSFFEVFSMFLSYAFDFIVSCPALLCLFSVDILRVFSASPPPLNVFFLLLCHGCVLPFDFFCLVLPFLFFKFVCIMLSSSFICFVVLSLVFHLSSLVLYDLKKKCKSSRLLVTIS